MANAHSSPILSRVKSWQLVGLGLTGWCTLYSVALLTCGSGSFLIGNAQGGCFAVSMTLAGVEARRIRRQLSAPADSHAWAGAVTTEQLNRAIEQSLRQQEYRVEPVRENDRALGFGVRSVRAGRTMVFETAHWREPAVDASHVLATDKNRIQAHAQFAIIVALSKPDGPARQAARTRPLDFLGEEQIKKILAGQESPARPG